MLMIQRKYELSILTAGIAQEKNPMYKMVCKNRQVRSTQRVRTKVNTRLGY